MEKHFLCHSVDVRMCSVKTTEVKMSHKESLTSSHLDDKNQTIQSSL